MDLPLRVVTPIVKDAMKEAEACRLRHAGLVEWALRVTTTN